MNFERKKLTGDGYRAVIGIDLPVLTFSQYLRENILNAYVIAVGNEGKISGKQAVALKKNR